MNYLSWQAFDKAVDILAVQLKPIAEGRILYGQPRGGLCLAVALSHALQIPLTFKPDHKAENIIWVDDILDSGETYMDAKKALSNSTVFAVWFIREKQLDNHLLHYAQIMDDDWLVFPWEQKQNAEQEKMDYETKN